MPRLILLVACAVALAVAPACIKRASLSEKVADIPAWQHPARSVRTVMAALTQVPPGRASTYVLPGACSFRLTIASLSPSSRIDVALLPLRRWNAWISCQGRLVQREVLCRAAHSCRGTFAGADASQPHVLVIGRASVNPGAEMAVRVHVSGAAPALARTNFPLHPFIMRAACRCTAGNAC